MYLHMWAKVDDFKRENEVSTDGEAIQEAFMQLERFKSIVYKLQQKAQEAEEWKIRANAQVEERLKNEKNKIESKPKKNTGST